MASIPRSQLESLIVSFDHLSDLLLMVVRGYLLNALGNEIVFPQNLTRFFLSLKNHRCFPTIRRFLDGQSEKRSSWVILSSFNLDIMESFKHFNVLLCNLRFPSQVSLCALTFFVACTRSGTASHP